MKPDIIYFDGHCLLCHGAVSFIIRRDPGARFLFAPLDTPVAKAALIRGGRPPSDRGSIILAEGDQLYDQSTAALRIARRLRGLWPLLYILIVVPRPLRDAVYRWIARHRYRWFGKVAECPLPTPDIRDRFLV
ncbi:MAG TPA: DCC1-like thiol-disulfide oxidoreductase family protein [Kiritimatiellia bacterium]|nr:DCC1-like thiol-disulfide oxidoreductase family protein [Kiritimatiellia bacterium]HMO98011.1 DCC1-like thiol-disulfide oxidoreductase family protein [Kiritimatiellia bacterium]